MTRIVVGFLRNFFSEQSTARAAVLRREPKIAIVEQMVPPIVKWLSGIMPSCERNAVELNRSGRITSCAFTETVKEWGAHTDRALFARVSSLCVLLRILRRMFICSHNLGQTSRLRSRNTLNTQQGEGYLKYSDKCSDKRKRRHWG